MGSKLLALFLSLLISLELFAQPNIPEQDQLREIALIYQRFRDGLSAEPNKFQDVYRTLKIKLTAFKSINNEISRNSSRNCRRFLAVTEKTYDQIMDMLEGLSIATENELQPLYQKSRLQILTAQAAVEHRQIAARQEAYFGIVDPSSRRQCDVKDRKQWEERSEDVLKTAYHASVVLLGVPGLRQMQQTEKHLAYAIATKEKSDQRYFWISITGAVLLSTLVWEFAPLLGAAMFPIIGVTNWGRFGLRIFGLSGEVVAQQYAHDHWVFPEDRILRERKSGITWNDFIATSEALLDTPLDSPRIYYDSLTRFYGAWNGEMFAALAPWQEALFYMEKRWGSIDQALLALNNDSVEVRLP